MNKYNTHTQFLDIWISKIPARWQAHKMKHLFSERSEKGYPNEPLLVASQNMGVVPKNVYGNRTVEAQKDLHLLKLVRVGDFVISLRSFQGGLEYAYYQGIISPAYTILIPHEPMSGSYFRYLAKSKPFIGLLTLCVTGIREGQNIDYAKLKNHLLPVPPREEQDQIVRFLDWKVSSINKLINIKNRMMNAIRSTIRNLRNWIADIMEAAKEALAETEAQAKNTSPDLVFLLRDYLNLRKAERSDWSRYGQQKGTTDDLKAVSKAIIYLKEHELFTLEDLDAALQGMSEKSKGINAAMKKASARMKVITGIQNAVADCQTHKAVHDKHLKIGWKARQAAFAESHKDELDSFSKAFRYLKKQGVDLNVNLDSLQAEYDKLKTTHTELAGQLAAAKEELQPMKDIRYWVSKVLTPEQSEVEKKPEPKHSVTEKMKFLQEQSNYQQEQKTPQQKKQDMEL